jgi:hypothetical protein
MKGKQLPSREDYYLSFLFGNISCPLWAEDDVRHGRAKLACNGHNIWIRYLFDSYKTDYWNIYVSLAHVDVSLAFIICNTT